MIKNRLVLHVLASITFYCHWKGWIIQNGTDLDNKETMRFVRDSKCKN